MMAILAMGMFAAAAPPLGLAMSGVTAFWSSEAIVLGGVPYLMFASAAFYARYNFKRLKNIPVLACAYPEEKTD